MGKTTKYISFGIIYALLLALPMGMFFWQQSRDTSEIRQAVLQKDIQILQTLLAKEKAAGDVKTDNWKQYCDPLTNLCFKYPPDWTFTEYGPDEFGNVSAGATSPGESIHFRYASPLVKDGSYMSAHIVQKTPMTVRGTALSTVGSYPVSSGLYQPTLWITDAEYADQLQEGTIGNGIVNPRFDIGTFDSIILEIDGPQLKSAAAAEAWFQSVEGKTAQAILSSFGQ